MIARRSIEKLYNEKGRPLILDGAVGSFLYKNNISESPLWSSLLNITDPEKVIDLHKYYISAGADIITTNTFRTNPAYVSHASIPISNEEFVHHSVDLAIIARGNHNIIIAGSNPPAEDCYKEKREISQEELYANHEQHINYLWNSGVDIILNETMSHLDELEIVSQICSREKIPFIVSLYFTSDLKLLGGEDIYFAIDRIAKYNPTAVSFNCIFPETFSNLKLEKYKNMNWGFYLNCGSGDVTDDQITCGIAPNEYAVEIKKYVELNPLFIGSCCGSSPEHTKALKEIVDEVN